MEARRPSHISEHALTCLQALAREGLGHMISLGGALGLAHYLDYRTTHDVDAWWSPKATRAERERVLARIEEALAPSGGVQRRTWGDVTSLDLHHGGKTVFSFQVASRSVQLEPPAPAPWLDVLLDSLPDLLASKMVALVERGAPRDFRDIHASCHAGLTTAAECWALWRLRQERAGDDIDPHRARLALETHLERIARHRPLETIGDAVRREEAGSVRRWFRTEFLDALPH